MRHPTLTALLLLLCGCVDPPPTGDDDDASLDDDDATDDDDASGGAVQEGPAVSCASPTSGFDRFEEEAAARGLDPVLDYVDDLRPCFEILGSVVSSDLDGDGDLDLLFHDRRGFPQLYANDGSGHFDSVAVGHDVLQRFGRAVLSFSAVDLDGDGLPEVVAAGQDLVLSATNLGGLQFADWEVLWDDPVYPNSCINSMSWGDLDGDGDLDLLLTAIDPVPDADWRVSFATEESVPIVGTPERLLFRDEGGWSEPTLLHQGPDGDDGLSILSFFSDRDDDGDLDLYISSDRAIPGNPPSAFLRNDGGPDRPGLVNDSAAIGADNRVSGMGLGSNDLNGDGWMDYCMTDVASHLQCMLSDGQGGYLQGGLALGLSIEWAETPDPNQGGFPPPWSGWGLEMLDLDNDGRLDAAAVAGGAPGIEMQDAIWQGQEGGTFSERSAQTGFNDPASHFGLVADDFDGDGYRDLVTSGWIGEVRFWSNPCGAEAWVEIELIGPPGNPEGLGARVEVVAGDLRDVQEVHGLRSLSQSSSRVHVGLGGREAVDSLRVRWADGAVSEGADLGVRRQLTVTHPAAR